MKFFGFFVFVCCLFWLGCSHPKWEYGMIIDAGSTRSTLYIYKWKYRESSTSIAPKTMPIEYAISNNSYPGIAKCCNSYNNMVEYLKPLIDFCKYSLSSMKKHFSNYRIYLKATAGMRIISDDKRVQILSWIDKFFYNKTLNPFLYHSNQGLVISGEEEALFGFIAVNYLHGVLETDINDKDTQTTPTKTYGIIDMGGQSVEITYVPKMYSNILSGFTSLDLWNNNYRLYTKSYLRYGNDGFELQIAQLAYNTYYKNNNSIIYNPCLFTGYNKSYNIININGINETVIEVGNNVNDSKLCSKFCKTLLYNDTICFSEPCSINGVYAPLINNNITYYGINGLFYTISGLNLNNNTSIYELNTISNEICLLTYKEFEYNNTYGSILVNNNDFNKYGYSRCLILTYYVILLHNAFGFNMNNSNIIYSNSISGNSLSWAQGSIIRDVNLNYYHLNTKNGLTSAGKRYMYSFFVVLGTALCIGACGLYLYCRRVAAKGNYQQML